MQSTRQTRCLLLLTSLALLALPAPAAAEAPAPAPGAMSIEARYEAGKEALGNKQPAEALEHFKAALSQSEGRSVITWQMLLAVAVAYKDLGYPVHTLEYFERFLTVTAPHQDIASDKWKRRRATVKDTIAELEGTLAMAYGFVSLSSTPAGARIFVDGRPAGADEDAITPFRLIVTPGAHTVRVELEGHEVAEERFEISAGAKTDISLALSVAAAKPPPPPPPAAAPVTAADPTVTATLAPEEAEGSIGPWVVLGSGGAITVVGMVMSILATGEEDAMKALLDRPTSKEEADAKAAEWDEHNSALDTYNTVGGVMFAVGFAGLAGGLIWALIDDPTDGAPDEAAQAPAVTLTPTDGGAFGQATWRF